MKRRIACLSSLALAVSSVSAQAHHSDAMFDRAQTVLKEGTIKEYQFQNPHTWIVVIVPGEGTWSFEGRPPGPAAREGLTPDKLAPGTKIAVHVHPLKDGRPGGSLIDFKLEGMSDFRYVN